MSAERCRVGAIFNGEPAFYQREEEYKNKEGRWAARPYFVLRSNSPITMSEGEARVLLQRLRSIGRNDAWIEDAKDGRKIDVPFEGQSSGEDNRTPVAATLDDDEVNGDWYLIRPGSTVRGPRWWIRIRVPGHPEEQTIYELDPLAVLRRARDLGWLPFAEKFVRPQPQPQQQAPQNTYGFRRRPGDIR
jgi:hypothetical protein